MNEQRVMPQKAMLLAAGQGTRLRPLTESISKCMMEIAGKPILEHNIEWLRKFGVTDLVVNLHYMPEAIMNHFGGGDDFGVRIKYSPEQELLGTAGAVKRVASFFDGPFFVWYGDNMSTCRLDHLWKLHQARGGIATIALHYREDPTQSGIVGLDDSDRIVRFLEKPRADQVFSHWVSAGIFVLEPNAIEAIPSESPADFGRDVFPALLESGAALYGYRMTEDEGLFWIDTLADYERVRAAMSVRQSTAIKEESA
jgi:Nucleoside-diphosphate-sugar pyrophosphorylase involved in lipopolysaccharide biosynthesis/translation initiation factor 2B, gamma/epsilon subunits (eIF-2Bgamma/eIF-2Bepsilon)